MSRTKTTFKSYAAAKAVVKKLGLRTMRDWNNFSKGQDPEGRTRPKDIPSNPWTIYGPQLQAENKKFSISEFLGASTKNGAKAKIPSMALSTASAATARKTRKTPLVNIITAQPVAVRAKSVAVMDRPVTYAKAKSLLRKMRVKSRADFNALVRMKLLPATLPTQPSQAFKQNWNGWRQFLGTP